MLIYFHYFNGKCITDILNQTNFRLKNSYFGLVQNNGVDKSE